MSTAFPTIVPSPLVGLLGLLGDDGGEGTEYSRGEEKLYEVLGSAGWGAGTARDGDRPLTEGSLLLAAMAAGMDCIDTTGELVGVGMR